MRKSQLQFWKSPVHFHGGSSSLGKRKCSRPIATKRPMHVVVKSERARGKWSFTRKRHAAAIESLLAKASHRFGVRVYRQANVGNHLHLLVQVKRRADFQNFLRVFLQGVAFAVAGARKGRPVGKFWTGLAFSRIVEWGRGWRAAHRYLDKNQLEGAGIPRARVDRWFSLKDSLARDGCWTEPCP